MTHSRPRQALLFLSHELNDDSAARFRRIETPEHIEKIILLDASACARTIPPANPVHRFHFDELCAKGYRPIRDRSIMPGSNHFPVIEFAFAHPEFDSVWAVEFDVIYTGDWRAIFDAVENQIDFVATHFRRYVDEPSWPWWKLGRRFNGQFAWLDKQLLLASFNPIFRLSHRAASFLRTMFHDGWMGHYEVSMATLLNLNGFQIEELGGDSPFTPRDRRGRFYRIEETLRWRPEFTPEAVRNRPNTLFHPVKQLDDPR
jgi:hypothetical protein